MKIYVLSFEDFIKESQTSIGKNEYLVYHGTDKEFVEFDNSTIGSNTGASWNGAGFYFSDTKAEASLYGKIVKTYIITLNNPIDLTKVVDTSVQGSGIVRLFAGINILKDIEKGNYTYTEIKNILDKEETEYNENFVSFSEISDKGFQHVWYEVGDKEYVIRNRTTSEISDKTYLKNMIIGTILYQKYSISDLPIRISEACNPYRFTEIVSAEGYDGVITHNSTVFSGNEYAVFDSRNIRLVS